ncbi:MAG: hypothetical protein H7Z42_23355 [Roseiflexaceae bacterium]|nr:hypothetical protein [Roseiflexaceae bacterium]
MVQKQVRLDYPEVLRALGHFIQREHLSEVSISEFDRGWVISGLTFKTTMQGFIRVPADFVVSHDDIRALSEQLLTLRIRAQPERRGWLR